MSGFLNKQVSSAYLTMPYAYTKAEELSASTSQPLHQRKRAPIIKALQAAMQAIGEGVPTVEQWRELADAVNLSETMLDLDLGLFDDPGQLFTDVVNAVADLGRQHGNGQTMQLGVEQLMHVTEFVEAYEQLLAQVSAQNYIRAHRATERRLRELLMNGPGEGDAEFIVN